MLYDTQEQKNLVIEAVKRLQVPVAQAAQVLKIANELALGKVVPPVDEKPEQKQKE